MGKMKRFFSLMLVLTIVLGSFGSVFAAEDVKAADEELKRVPTDVIGTEYEKAVARLVAFGVLDGYKDGTYRPTQDVTRAEFAKILVEALGIGNAAKAAAGTVTFKDVPASHWASGYVSTASGHGLLKGFPDGTFKPEQQVSYADALTMLVRALGYQDNFLKGAWPGSHIAKAAEAGITSGVKFEDARGFANRGNVAQMVNNTLDCDVVRVETYKDGTVEYYESEITLLKDKLDISKYEDTRVVADKVVNDGLDEDEITVLFTKKIDKKDEQSVKKSYDEGEEVDFTILGGANPRRIIGEKASLYVNNRDKVVYIESQNDDKAYFDYVQAVGSKDKDGEITELDLVRFDKEYKFDEDSKIYVFEKDQYKEKTVDKKDGIDANLSDVLGKVGKFVVKNNRIVYAEIMGSNEALPWMLVLKNDKGLLEGVNQEDEEFDLDLTKDGNYDGILIFDALGNRLDAEDIEKGNIVYAQKLDYDGDDYAHLVVVQDNVKEGKLTRVKNDRIGIDDKEIKMVRYKDGKDVFQAYYSVEGFEDVKQWGAENNADWDKDMEDADEEDIRAYLDATGKIAFLETEAKGTAGYKYGVVTKAFADNDRIKVYTYIDGKDGDEITYKVDKEKTVKEAKRLDEIGNETGKTRQVKTGDVVKFKLNKDGEIAKEELYVMDPENFWVMQQGKDFGKDSIPSILKERKDGNDKRSFAIDNKAVIIDAKGLEPGTDKLDADDFGISKWDDMKEDNHNSKLKYFVFTKRNKSVDVDALVFVGDEGASTSSDEEAIYVIKPHLKGGDVYVKYVSYETGKVEEAEVDKYVGNKSGSTWNKVEEERPYIARLRSSGKVELYDDTSNVDDLKYVAGIVKKDSKRGNVFELEGSNEQYKMTSGTVVYEEDSKKTTSNVREGDAVYFIVENDVNIRVIERVTVSKEVNAIKDGEDPYKTGYTTVYTKDGKVTDKPTEYKGLVTMISGNAFVIDGETTHFIDAKTILTNSKNKVVLVGLDIVNDAKEGHLAKNDQVEVTVKDGVMTIKRIKEASEINDDIAEANKKIAETFKADYKKVLDLEESKVELSDKKAIVGALDAYEELSKAVKDLLTTEKATLDGLKARIDKLEADADKEAAAVKAVNNAASKLEMKKALEAEELELTIPADKLDAVAEHLVAKRPYADKAAIKAEVKRALELLKPVVNKDVLNQAIKDAEKVEVVATSVDGADVEQTNKWTTEAELEAFNNAISTAKKIAGKSEAIQTEVDDAVTDLEAAVNTYKAAKKDGTK